MNRKITTLFCVVALFFSLFSCSANKVLEPAKQPITEQKTYVVIGLAWEETATLQPKDWWFTDEELLEEEVTVTTSYELLENEALVKNKRIKQKNSKRLHSPLHYIYNQEYFFVGENSQKTIDYVLKKSNRNLDSYKKYGLYEVNAKTLTLDGLRQKVLLLHEVKGHDIDPKLYRETTQNIDLEPIRWELVPGKINYLGEIKIFFDTQRIYYGILLPKVVNETIAFSHMQVQDDFLDWQQRFQNNYPDLVVDNIKNISINAVYNREKMQ